MSVRNFWTSAFSRRSHWRLAQGPNRRRARQRDLGAAAPARRNLKPYRELVEAGRAEPCYHGPSGYRAYIVGAEGRGAVSATWYVVSRRHGQPYALMAVVVPGFRLSTEFPKGRGPAPHRSQSGMRTARPRQGSPTNSAPEDRGQREGEIESSVPSPRVKFVRVHGGEDAARAGCCLRAPRGCLRTR
jgi:hypothetical protein